MLRAKQGYAGKTEANVTAFGAPMPGRTYVGSNSYRFGFDGQEKDDEISGGGNTMTAEYWEYDTRLGRRWNVDPAFKKYPWESPYSAFNGNPILYNDPKGESGEPTIDKQAKTITIESKLIFYGSTTPFAASQRAAKVEKAWNDANGSVNINGVAYKVQFKVTGEFRSDGEDLKKEVENNTDIKNNYIKINNGDEASSTDFNGGGNTGTWTNGQIAENQTTEAHEYGHGLGLDHEKEASADPTIMMTVNDLALVDTKNTKATGGTPIVDVTKRKVSQRDIDNLHLDKVKFDKNGKGKLGSITDKYHGKVKE